MTKTVEIDSLAVDKDREVICYGYRILEDGEIIRESAIEIDGEEYLQAKDAVNMYANGIAQGQANANQPIALDIFGIIETVIESGAAVRLGLK